MLSLLGLVGLALGALALAPGWGRVGDGAEADDDRIDGEEPDTIRIDLDGAGMEDHGPPEPDGAAGPGPQGGDGADILFGTDRDDMIDGRDGADFLDGGGGDDRMEGGRGDDALHGAAGDDRLGGGPGDDLLAGHGGDDDLDGGEGDDSLWGGEGDDTLRGGDGTDALLGGAGDDRLTGGAGEDAMQGGYGDDILDGREDARQERDVLNGGDGDDRLLAGAGDHLHGGAGADRFGLSLPHMTGRPAVIEDFDPREDVLLVLHAPGATPPVLGWQAGPEGAVLLADGRAVALLRGVASVDPGAVRLEAG